MSATATRRRILSDQERSRSSVVVTSDGSKEGNRAALDRIEAEHAGDPGPGIRVDGWATDPKPESLSMGDLLAVFDRYEAENPGALDATRPQMTSGSTPLTDLPEPQRQAGQAWLRAGIEAMLDDLRASHGWPEGHTDERGRGWEKLLADVAMKMQRYAAALGESDAGHLSHYLDAAPRGGYVDDRWLANKWRSQQGKAHALGPWPVPEDVGQRGSIFDDVPGSPAMTTTQEAPVTATTDDADRRIVPALDWAALWADDSEEEWIVEPILPARRLVALYSPPKVGKSLLMLELAASVAAGRYVLGVTPDRPRSVLYVDFENDPKADIRPRLSAMGYTPADLEHLHYLSFPAMAYLDSSAGADQLMSNVHHYGAEVVVIDTVSRSVAGEENENDTWLAFYRHTGLALKQAQVACIRLDHTGKDETKGQRGASAKSGDVDAVWRLSEEVKGETYRLTCEAHRMPVHEPVITINRRTNPLRHDVRPGGNLATWDAKVDAVMRALDEAKVPTTLGRDKAKAALVDFHGENFQARNEVLAEAIRRRKNLSPDGGDRSLSDDLSRDARDRSGQEADQ